MMLYVLIDVLVTLKPESTITLIYSLIMLQTDFKTKKTIYLSEL